MCRLVLQHSQPPSLEPSQNLLLSTDPTLRNTVACIHVSTCLQREGDLEGDTAMHPLPVSNCSACCCAAASAAVWLTHIRPHGILCDKHGSPIVVFHSVRSLKPLTYGRRQCADAPQARQHAQICSQHRLSSQFSDVAARRPDMPVAWQRASHSHSPPPPPHSIDHAPSPTPPIASKPGTNTEQEPT
jgi:hypothetical protein